MLDNFLACQHLAENGAIFKRRMPIYEFSCPDCGEKFEKLVLRHASDLAVPCPRCDSTTTQQLFSTFAVASSTCRSEAAGMGSCGASPSGRFT